MRRVPRSGEGTIVAEWIPREPSGGRGIGSGRSRGQGDQTGTRISRLTMRDLGIGSAPPGAEVASNSSSTGPLGSQSDLGMLGPMKDTVAIQHLFDRIESALFYPRDLSEAGVEGEVTVNLIFDEGGRVDWGRSGRRSDSRYLRVFVRRLLRHTLEEPIPSAFREKDRSVTCRFRFERVRVYDAMDASVQAHQGRGIKESVGWHFTFYRSSKVLGEWKLGPFAGYAFAPSLGIDPDWFVDSAAHLWNRLTGRKAEIDPLERYRNDPGWREP